MGSVCTWALRVIALSHLASLYPFRFLSSLRLSSFAPCPFWLGNALGAAPRDGDPITARGCMDTQGPIAFWQWARLVAAPCALSLSHFRCLPLHPPTLGRTFSPYTSLLGSVPVSRLCLSALHGIGRVTQWTSRWGFWVFQAAGCGHCAGVVAVFHLLPVGDVTCRPNGGL